MTRVGPKELNRVSFNGAPAKYDIRTWSPDHTKMGKGITLTSEEFKSCSMHFKIKKKGSFKDFFFVIVYGYIDIKDIRLSQPLCLSSVGLL